MANSRSQFVQYVDTGPALSSGRVIVHAVVRFEVAREIQQMCQARGWHLMRFYREAFDSGLGRKLEAARIAETQRPGRGAHAPGLAALYADWLELETTPNVPGGSEDPAHR